MDTQITQEHYELFFSKNSEYYLEVLKKKDENKTSFNFSAFLFGPFWMVYRKMYLYAIIFLCFVIIETLLEDFVLQNYFPTYNPKGIQSAITIGIAMGMGYSSNWFYLNFAKSKIQKILNNTNDQNSTEQIKIQGGVSWIPVIILLSIIIGIILLALYADGYFNV